MIAGGGGAFLHPAPMARRRLQLESEWPSPEQSRALLWQAPWKIARGRSGFLPHLLLGLLFTPTMLAGGSAPLGTPLVVDPFHAERWDYIYVLQKGGKVVEQRRLIVLFQDDRLLRLEGDVTPAASSTPDAAASAKP